MKNIFKRNQIVITALAIMIVAAFYLNYAGRINAGNEVAQTSAQATQDSDETVDADDISDEDVLAETQDDSAAEVLDLLTQATDGDDDIVSNDVDLTTDTPSTDTAEATTDTIETDSDAVVAEDSAESTDTSESTEDTTETTGTPGEAVLTSSSTSVGLIAEAKLNREQVRAKNKETLLEIINNENISDDQKQNAIDTMIEMTDIAEREANAETLLVSKGFTDAVVSITGDTADVVVNISEVSDSAIAQIEDVVKRKAGVSAENITITPVTNE